MSELSTADTNAVASTVTNTGLFQVFKTILSRELRLSFTSWGEGLNPLLFFVIVVSLFPLGVGPEPKQLASIGPGVIWVSALLAMLMSLDGLFAADHRDGTLEQWVLSGQPLSLISLAKVCAHWLRTGLPLVLMSPLLGLLMNLPSGVLFTLAISLLLGTLILSLVGAIGAALTLTIKQGGVLLALLVLPLSVPVLIFGAGAVQAVAEQREALGQLALLAAGVMAALTLAPIGIAAALRVGVASGD